MNYEDEIYRRKVMWKKAKEILERLKGRERKTKIQTYGWYELELPTIFQLSELMLKYHKDEEIL